MRIVSLEQFLVSDGFLALISSFIFIPGFSLFFFFHFEIHYVCSLSFFLCLACVCVRSVSRWVRMLAYVDIVDLYPHVTMLHVYSLLLLMSGLCLRYLLLGAGRCHIVWCNLVWRDRRWSLCCIVGTTLYFLFYCTCSGISSFRFSHSFCVYITVIWCWNYFVLYFHPCFIPVLSVRFADGV